MSKFLAFAAIAAMAPLEPGMATAKPVHRTVSVVIDNLSFGPIPSNLRVGDTIVWENRDIFRHSATAPGHFNVDLAPGEKGRMTLGKAGVFAFACKYHPGMKGVLKVGL
ncbi:MAG TPA: hypothetical protein VLM18_04895 [Croceibacterium sp.]|nr:hypothetical protein [Croceibacterium sp.]